MADVKLVLSNPLCFLFTKYSKCNTRTIKCTLVEFYKSEDLQKAKQQLQRDVEGMNLTLKVPRLAQRRDGDGRAMNEADDLFTMITFLDENKLMDRLPVYVTDNLDNVPSLRLFDGDMRILVNVMEKLDLRITDLGAAMAAISGEIRTIRDNQAKSGLQPAVNFGQPRPTLPSQPNPFQLTGLAHPPPGPPPPPPRAPFVPPPRLIQQPPSRPQLIPSATGTESVMRDVTSSIASAPGNSIPGPFMNAAAPVRHPLQPLQPTANWAHIAASSTPITNPFIHKNRYDALGSTDDESQGHFTEFHSRQSARRQKRARELSELQIAQPSRPVTQQQPTQQKARKGKPRMFGKSFINDGHISAAARLFKRAVFCVDNVDLSCTADNMTDFVRKLGVEVVSCRDAKPRRRRQYPMNGLDGAEPGTTHKAFRLCINAEDETRLLNPSFWPDSIVISDWYFTQKKSVGDTAENKRRRVSGGSASGGQSDVAREPSHSSGNSHDARLTSPKVISANSVGMDTSTPEACVSDQTVIYVASQDGSN